MEAARRSSIDTTPRITPTATSHPSVVERYYTPRFKADGKEGDMCILTHSNRISVITLAPSHLILKEKKTVVKVNFQPDESTNRLENKVSGKSKRGAQMLTATSTLCCVTCSDKSQYRLPACMKGSLVEVNENLLDNPQLLTQKPSTDGYVAIVLSRLQDHQAEMDRLLSQAQYDEHLAQLQKESATS